MDYSRENLNNFPTLVFGLSLIQENNSKYDFEVKKFQIEKRYKHQMKNFMTVHVIRIH